MTRVASPAFRPITLGVGNLPDLPKASLASSPASPKADRLTLRFAGSEQSPQELLKGLGLSLPRPLSAAESLPHLPIVESLTELRNDTNLALLSERDGLPALTLENINRARQKFKTIEAYKDWVFEPWHTASSLINKHQQMRVVQNRAGDVVACVNIQKFPRQPGYVYLSDIGVRFEERGKGIGQAMMMLLLNDLKRQNVRTVGLLAGNHNNQRFYQRLGFQDGSEKISQAPGELQWTYRSYGPDFPQLKYMELALAPASSSADKQPAGGLIARLRQAWPF
jgi:ribosomal protein S18 acetylase RimI-like enzyme